MNSRFLPTCALIVVVAAIISSGCNKAKELADEAQKKISEGAKEVSADIAQGAKDAQKSLSKGVNEIQKDGKELAGQAGTQVNQQLNLAGSLTISGTGIGNNNKIERKGCYLTLTPLSGTRRSVLQLRSYPDPAEESYPSIYIHALVSATSLEELAKDSASVRLYVQAEENGPIWFSDEGQNVELKIVSIADGKVTAKVETGKLRNTDTGQEVEMRGEFLAVSDW
jgi:hypothetical protein